MSIKWPQYLAATFAANGAFICGSALGWSAPAAKHILKEHEYGFQVTLNQFSLISSIFPLGAIPGSIVTGLLINIIGRKTTMQVLFLPYILAYLLLAFATNTAMLLVGRFIVGIAVGGFSIVVPVYIGEISEKEIRGALGTFYQMLLTLGVLFEFALGPYVSLFVLNLATLGIPVLFSIAFFFMPETPLFLNENDKKEEAKKAVIWLRGKNSDYEGFLKELDAQLENKKAKGSNLFVAVKAKAPRRAIIITVTTMAFQQICGIKALMFYTTDIFRMSTKAINAEIGTIIIGITQSASVLIASFTIDKFGRRILLFISGVGMFFCNGLLGLYFCLKIDAPDTSVAFASIPLISLALFVLFFSIGYGPISWVLIGEMFTPEVKGLASALCSLTHWLLSFLVTKNFVDLSKSIGLGPTFWMLSVIILLGAVFTTFCVVETKGLSLLEITAKLEGKSNPVED